MTTTPLAKCRVPSHQIIIHQHDPKLYRVPLWWWECSCGELPEAEHLTEIDAMWWAGLHLRVAMFDE